jgi:putative transposase
MTDEMTDMTDQAVAELTPVVGTRRACASVGVTQAGYYRRHRQSPPPLRPQRVRAAQPRALSAAERIALHRVLDSKEHVVRRRRRSTPSSWTRASTWRRCPRCTGCCATTTRYASAAGRPRTRRPRSRSCWPPSRTRSTPGTSPSCSARRSGPTTTCTCSSPVRAHRYLQPLRARLDAGPRRERPPRRGAARRHHRQAAHRPRPAHPPRRPRLADDGQAGGVPAGRSRRDQVALPAALLQRQPVLREPVPDHEVPPRVPRALRQLPGCARLLWPVLRLVQRRPPSLRHRVPHPADVHYGRAELVRARRADVLTAAYAKHPERFVGKPPQPPALPTAVWINEPQEDPATTQ